MCFNKKQCVRNFNYIYTFLFSCFSCLKSFKKHYDLFKGVSLKNGSRKITTETSCVNRMCHHFKEAAQNSELLISDLGKRSRRF